MILDRMMNSLPPPEILRPPYEYKVNRHLQSIYEREKYCYEAYIKPIIPCGLTEKPITAQQTSAYSTNATLSAVTSATTYTTTTT